MPRTSLAPRADPLDRDLPSCCRHPASRRPSRRLKMCFISETLHAGVGRHVADAISELSHRGHEVHLIYSPIRADPFFVATLGDLPKVHCEAVRIPRAIGLDDISAFRAIKRYVLSSGPFDIIHGHSSKGGGHARLLRLFVSTPVLYTPHAFATLSPGLSTIKRLAYRALELIFSQVTERIICTSRDEFEHARELGVPAKQLALIMNGSAPCVAPTREEVRSSLGLTADRIVVGFAGRMEDQKAPERLIDAARALLPALPNLTVMMIGEGPKRPVLEATLEQAGLSHRVIWLGAVDARKYMPAMDIFVMPSLYEGFAYVLLEALYAGLPIVSTPVGGAYESVKPGVNGFIAPHGSTDDMIAAINTLASDEPLRRRMAEASLMHAAHFSIPRMVHEMEELYTRLRASASKADPSSPIAM
jgi:glycosyltransferase involved in cell wall biosynthesis